MAENGRQPRPTPMTLGNMRDNGVRALIAQCRDCRHQADVQVDQLDAALFVPDIATRMVCSACGSRRIETRPAWHTLKRSGMR